jgi:hypothetical protein
MKKSIVFALCFAVVLFVDPFQGAPLVRAVTVSGNGDVNGDESRDLSDAIYLLAHLFQGGDTPLPCPSAGGAAGVVGGGGGPSSSPLPPTGQTLCYDEAGAETDCGAGDCLGQDGFYQAGCSASPRFVDNGDGTVTDNCTGLMWQQDTADIDGGGITPSECLGGGDPQPPVCCGKFGWTDIDVQGDDIAWCDALQYCKDLIFATHEDWRLPNIQELLSIVDYSVHSPAIDTNFFSVSIPPAGPPPGGCELFYWSSTKVEDGSPNDPGSPYAYEVDFTWGNTANQYNNNLHYVRAVRSVLPAGAGGEISGEPGQGAGILANGDVNGDLSLDLSDAIYLLAFLFQGGPEPEPCPDLGPPPETGCGDGNCCGNGIDDDADGTTDCDDADCTDDLSCPAIETDCGNGIDDDLDDDIDCDDSDCMVIPPEDSSLLPDTGVTLCWNLGNEKPADCAEAACKEAPCPGQDGFYETGCASDGTRFTDNLDGTVTDNCTGLMWQTDTANTDGIGGVDNDDKLSWCDALQHCEDLTLATHSDWRLPNIREIQSIVDHSGGQTVGVFPPFIQATRVAGDPEVRYWSSTNRPGSPPRVFNVVVTGVPYVSWGGSNQLNFVRAVRTAQ